MTWIKIQIWKLGAYIKKYKILTLVFFSLIGGLPGIINIYNWISDKPKFGFHLDAVLYGETGNPPQRNKFLLLSGAVFNDGKMPLFPAHFHVKAQYENGAIIETYAVGITDSLMSSFNKSNGQTQVLTGKATIDLMKLIKVNEKDAYYGLLFLPYDYTTKDFGLIKYIELTCTDIFHKNFSTKLNMKDFRSGTGYIPKVDVLVK